LTASALTVNGTAAGRSILFEDGFLVRIGTFTAVAGGYNVDIRSSEFVVVNDTNFLNTGSLTLGNHATDSLTFAGGLGAVSQSAITLVGSASAIGSGNPLEFLSPNTPTAPTGAGIVNGSSLGGVAGGIARLDFGGNMNYTTTNFT
ncbi:MAG: hypothetical protein ACK6EB_10800, partial [Planctomyces sp.]